MIVAALSVLAAGALTDPTTLTTGRDVFEYWCAPCHGPGIGNPGEHTRPGTKALELKYQGKLPALLTERKDLTPQFVSYTVRNGVSVMPFFRKTEITDAQLEALAVYLAKTR